MRTRAADAFRIAIATQEKCPRLDRDRGRLAQRFSRREGAVAEVPVYRSDERFSLGHSASATERFRAPARRRYFTSDAAIRGESAGRSMDVVHRRGGRNSAERSNSWAAASTFPRRHKPSEPAQPVTTRRSMAPPAWHSHRSAWLQERPAPTIRKVQQLSFSSKLSMIGASIFARAILNPD